MEEHEIVAALAENRLHEEVDAIEQTGALHGIHQVLFSRALGLGIPRAELVRRIDDATFQVARSSMLDINELKLMNRKTLEGYDPKLARDVYRAQIHVMIDACAEAAASAG